MTRLGPRGEADKAQHVGMDVWEWICGNGSLPGPGQIRARSDKGTDCQGLSSGENLVLGTD